MCSHLQTELTLITGEIYMTHLKGGKMKWVIMVLTVAASLWETGNDIDKARINATRSKNAIESKELRAENIFALYCLADRLCQKIALRRVHLWFIDGLIKHIDCYSSDSEGGFLISACLSVLKLLYPVCVEPSGTEHVGLIRKHSSVSPNTPTPWLPPLPLQKTLD